MTDVIAELKAAIPAAHQAELEVAQLDGRVNQAVLDLLSKDPRLGEIATVVDDVRAALDTAKPFLTSLPAPYAGIFAVLVNAVDVADKSLEPLGL